MTKSVPVLNHLALFGGEASLPAGPRLHPCFGPDLPREIEELLRTRPLSSLFGDHDVCEFEKDFAARIGSPGAVAIGSGTAALHVALTALGIGQGDEVAVTCLSFVSTASVILQVGATPVFVDIDAQNLALDVEDLARKLTPRTRAVIVAHLFGIPGAIVEVKRFCEEHDLWLIEDACQSIGAEVEGRAVGSFGDIGCFSFNVNKIVQTGEGGMLISREPGVLEVARELRVNGLSPFGVERLGFNYTMTNLQALIGRYQLARLDKILERRREFCARMAAVLTPHVHVFPEYRGNVRRAYYNVPVRLPTQTRAGRDLVVAALVEEGVPVRIYEVLYRHEAVFGPPRGPPCLRAEREASSLLTIGLSHDYLAEDFEVLCAGATKVLALAAEIEKAVIEEQSASPDQAWYTPGIRETRPQGVTEKRRGEESAEVCAEGEGSKELRKETPRCPIASR